MVSYCPIRGYVFLASTKSCNPQRCRKSQKDEAVDNVDYNGDGDKNDQVWINNNSVVAHDHVGF